MEWKADHTTLFKWVSSTPVGTTLLLHSPANLDPTSTF